MDESRVPEPAPGDEPDTSARRPAGLNLPWAEDYSWANAEREKPNQGALGLYEGLWVVVYDKRVVGAVGERDGSKPVTRRVAEYLGVPESRLLLTRVDAADDPIFIC